MSTISKFAIGSAFFALTNVVTDAMVFDDPVLANNKAKRFMGRNPWEHDKEVEERRLEEERNLELQKEIAKNLKIQQQIIERDEQHQKRERIREQRRKKRIFERRKREEIREKKIREQRKRIQEQEEIREFQRNVSNGNFSTRKGYSGWYRLMDKVSFFSDKNQNPKSERRDLQKGEIVRVVKFEVHPSYLTNGTCGAMHIKDFGKDFYANISVVPNPEEQAYNMRRFQHITRSSYLDTCKAHKGKFETLVKKHNIYKDKTLSEAVHFADGERAYIAAAFTVTEISDTLARIKFYDSVTDADVEGWCRLIEDHEDGDFDIYAQPYYGNEI